MATITSTFKMRDNATRTIEKVSSSINKFMAKVDKINNSTSNIKNPQKDVENGFSKWEAKIVSINQGLQLIQTSARAVGKMLNYADSLTLTKARLDLMNDGLQTTEELQNKIFAAAQRSRGSYEDMSQSVAKLGLLAGDAFKNNDEMIAFSEMMNKSFKVSGASQQEISSATYQLTQAMAAGKLQGDEFRAIMENAPMLADAIAKYTGKSKGELKEMSSEGLITADIIKNALFSAADDINAKYEQMPMTFGDAMTQMKNKAAMAFQPVANRISELLNSEKFTNFIKVIEKAISGVATAVEWSINLIAKAAGWIYDNLDFVLLMLTVIGGFMLMSLIPSIMGVVSALLLKAAAWAIANWQMLAVLGVLAIGYALFGTVEGALTTLAWVIIIVAGAMAIWHIAQWALNTALYACPIVWIIVLIIALVAAIYLFMQWMAKATGLAGSGLGMIAGGVNVVIQFFKNLGLLVANIGLGMWNVLSAVCHNIGTAFHNVLSSIQSWFYGMLSTALEVVDGICEALNKLPFVEFDYSGITKKAKDYAKKSEEAANSKEDYKSLVDEFNKGMSTFETFQDGWVEDAFNSGAAWGDKVADDIGKAIGSFDPTKALGDLMGDDNSALDSGYDYSSLLDGNGNMPVSLEKDKTKGEVDISDEDLKMLKDIATREYMLNYKHITPNVTIEFGDIRETADVNQVRDAISKMMEEELAELYVVEEA